MGDSMEIRQAVSDDLTAVADLFDAYRQFYRQASDLAGARRFIAARLATGDSTIFLAEINNQPAGFAQLYPSFTSVGMRRLFVLNDLYVAESARNQGVATALLNRCAGFARQAGAARLELSTEASNHEAQALYEKLHWTRDDAYLHYFLDLT